MNNTSKLLGAFTLGAVAAIAIMKLMESEKGQEFMESAKEKAHSTAEDIKAKIQQLEQELADLVGHKEQASDKTV